MRRSVVVFALVGSAIFGAAPTARADSIRAEDAKLRAGIGLLQGRLHDRALAEFERLYGASKKTRALYWIGRTHEAAGRPVNALRAYTQYIREANLGSDTTDAIEVMGRIQLLSLQVAAVAVTAPVGARIAVDDVPAGEAPLAEPIPVAPGTHTITATGCDPQSVELAAESRTTVEFVARAPVVTSLPAASPVSVTPLPERATPGGSGASLPTIVGFAGSGLLAAGSVYFAIRSAGTAADFSAKKGALGASHAELEELQGTTRLQAGLALGLGAAAVAAAGVTLLVLRKDGGTRVVTTGSALNLEGKF